MSEIEIKISKASLDGKVNTAVPGGFRLIATRKIDGAEIALEPGEWSFSRSLPGGVSVDATGTLIGQFGSTAFPAGRIYEVHATVSHKRCIALGVFIQRVEQNSSENHGILKVNEPGARKKQDGPPIESNRITFRIKVSRDATDGESNEIVAGNWNDYSHINLRETGSTVNVSNVWSMTGLTSSYSLTGISNSDDNVAIRTDMTGQLFRLSLAVTAFTVSATEIYWRMTQSDVRHSMSRSSTDFDTQYNRITENRFVMVDPPVLDVEFNAMNPISSNWGLWNGIQYQTKGSGARMWKNRNEEASRWYQLNEAALTAVNPGLLLMLQQSEDFRNNWSLMRDIQGCIPELNRKIPGAQNPHFPPLMAEPSDLSDLYNNNGSARLVVRSGFAQLFHMHSGWGRSFYFSAVTNYYLSTVRQYYDELDQTLGKQFTLINGEAHYHYRCRQKTRAGFANWDTAPNQVIRTDYEGAMVHRIVHVPKENADPQPQALFSMIKTGTAPMNSEIKVSAGMVEILDDVGDDWNTHLRISRRDRDFTIGLRQGRINLSSDIAETTVRQRATIGSANVNMQVDVARQAINMTCQAGLTVNGARVALAT